MRGDQPTLCFSKLGRRTLWRFEPHAFAGQRIGDGPVVAIGMEGAPGHQAAKPENGHDLTHGSRGLYGGFPTMGGFDQMVAKLGGAWDALLGSGMHWIITASSDSHGHWTEGGADFWPGEYSKTWVFARTQADDILDGLRAGRVFVATGNLIDRLDFSVAAADAPSNAVAMGSTLALDCAQDVIVTIRFRPGSSPDASRPVSGVDHVDLIVGNAAGAEGDSNPTTRLAKRFTSKDWRREGDMLVMTYRMHSGNGASYLRLRGTSTRQSEPEVDEAGEDPWQDLWFYSNPVYLEI